MLLSNNCEIETKRDTRSAPQLVQFFLPLARSPSTPQVSHLSIADRTQGVTLGSGPRPGPMLQAHTKAIWSPEGLGLAIL
ncbi:hypothetical protein XENTR_v10010271 [Xenopus tropicalis]|nr:hypothetical protein XENTR_v10010271 [Xenopus tropicalis]